MNAVITAFLFDKNKILVYNIYIKKGSDVMLNYLDDFICKVSCEEYYEENKINENELECLAA